MNSQPSTYDRVSGTHRRRDAYLELRRRGLAGAFPLAVRVGRPRIVAWARQRDYLPEAARPEFDRGF